MDEPAGAPPEDRPVLDLGPEPEALGTWLRALGSHREVLVRLAVKDFTVRYKRASLGVLWAVALPLVQAGVMVTVFSRLGLDDGSSDYVGSVVAGMAVWSFVALSLPSATTAVVDGAGLTDKVWFPRALLPLATVAANLAGLGVALVILVGLQVARGHAEVRLLLLVPDALLAVALVAGLALVASALHVRFRDVRFLVQAGLLLLFYATPILYPPARLGALGDWLAVNPFTGAVQLAQHAATGSPAPGIALAATGAWTVLLLGAGATLHRRGDRTMVDLL